MILASAGTASAGKFKVLHSFCQRENCRDGSVPMGALVIDSAGNFFGATSSGGKGNGFGTIFELEKKASGKFAFKTIYRFYGNECGTGPEGPLMALVPRCERRSKQNI
jgi:uncharacterized repeat protein (TIGR03803 family)